METVVVDGKEEQKPFRIMQVQGMHFTHASFPLNELDVTGHSGSIETFVHRRVHQDNLVLHIFLPDDSETMFENWEHDFE